MAKKKTARLACRALDYVVPAHPPDIASGQAALQHFLASTAGSPARAAVEGRSDHSFVQLLIDGLVGSGLEPTVACAASAAVLANPTLAVQKTTDEGVLILQSIVLARPDESATETQVVVRLLHRGGKPPLVEFLEADVVPFDVTDDNEVCGLVEAVERWSREFPMPAHVFPNPLPLPEWAWLGDLTWAGLLELPADWREQLKAIGGVYGEPPLVAESAEAASQYKVGERCGFVVAPPAVKWSSDVHIPEESGCEIESIGSDAVTFADLLQELRSLVYAKAAAAHAPPPPSRDLEDSEVVYHRKIGNSRAFDRFDEGTAKPCKHGAASFVSWGGDKAKKGMARRYDNFTAAMLIHCSKFPNCNVYGVDAGRGGLKTAEDDAITE